MPVRDVAPRNIAVGKVLGVPVDNRNVESFSLVS
jgi:hypothetical protein